MTRCPPWCPGDHDPGDMHCRDVGRIRHGAAEAEVSVRYQLGGFRTDPPVVLVSARGAPDTSSADLAFGSAGGFACLMALLNLEDLADLVRRAAALIERPV